jgi:hypothetical protein
MKRNIVRKLSYSGSRIWPITTSQAECTVRSVVLTLNTGARKRTTAKAHPTSQNSEMYFVPEKCVGVCCSKELALVSASNLMGN